jgi:hypothetical protein
MDNGNAVARQYDAFGRPCNGNMTDRVLMTLAMQPPTMFGFTDQNHGDLVLLIHMCSRLFES